MKRALPAVVALVACAALSACEPVTVSLDQPPTPSVGGSAPAGAAEPPEAPAGTPERTEAPQATPSPAPGDGARPDVPSGPKASSAPSGSQGTNGLPGRGDGPRADGEGIGRVGAPRVFMAQHGSNGLANDAGRDDEWVYVRKNLDGLWGNAAGVSVEEQARLWSKLTTRNYMGIKPLRDAPFPLGRMDKIDELYPWLELNREAIVTYGRRGAVWAPDLMKRADAEYTRARSVPESSRFDEVWSGWSIHGWEAPMTGSNAQVLRDSDGWFVECGADFCSRGGLSENLVRAVTTAHAQGKNFMWFTSPVVGRYGETGALERFQRTYDLLREKGLWRTNDVVMVMNYGGDYRMTPETVDGKPADTITGMLYWALKQQESDWS